MNLLILGQPCDLRYGAKPAYRGTYRGHPCYREDLSDSSDANHSFLWFLAEGGESGVVYDLDKARRLIKAFADLRPPDNFEIVQVLEPEEAKCCDAGFLGLDLSCGLHNSLLYLGLEFPLNWRIRRQSRKRLDSIIMRFRPLLNRVFLFSDVDVANECLAEFVKLQDDVPGLFLGSEPTEYRVVGLRRVDSQGIEAGTQLGN